MEMSFYFMVSVDLLYQQLVEPLLHLISHLHMLTLNHL